MTKKVYYSDAHVKFYVHEIIRRMYKDNWRPDYVVGLTRGGLVPANMLSQYLDVPMQSLNVSLRDANIGPCSDLGMAEDAFGFNSDRGKNILIVDDINDTGATLNWIKKDWQNSCLPNSPKWDNVWNQNVRFAVLINNAVSEFTDVDYTGLNINKFENPEWCVFPWENWWE